MTRMLNSVTSAFGFWPYVDQPTPDYNGPGSSALTTIANAVYADVLILALIGGLAAAAMIAIGHFTSNNRVHKAGIVGVISVIAAAAVASGIAALINWGSALQVV
jgi:cag pathogenicity island protein 25